MPHRIIIRRMDDGQISVESPTLSPWDVIAACAQVQTLLTLNLMQAALASERRIITPPNGFGAS